MIPRAEHGTTYIDNTTYSLSVVRPNTVYYVHGMTADEKISCVCRRACMTYPTLAGGAVGTTWLRQVNPNTMSRYRSRRVLGGGT